MSFQAYLDTIEDRTGLTPARLLDVAHDRGYDATTKAATVVEWFRADYSLGRGHAMAFCHVLKNGAEIGDKHVGTTGTHRDASATLRLDGKSQRDQG